MTRVLVVDDARLLAELEQTPMGRSTVTLAVIGAGDDIVERVGALRPAVVILEEGEFTPEASEALRRLRDHDETRAVKVIYIGVAVGPGRAMLEAGDVFIPRPVTRRELRAAVQRVLGLPDRAAPRRDVDLPALLELETGDPLSGRCLCLSQNGALLSADAAPHDDAAVTLRLALERRELVLPATVVRAAAVPGGHVRVAVRFGALDARTRAALSRYVRAAAAAAAHAAGEAGR